MGMQTDKVSFNVGGKIFETTATTLANACRNSLFGAMFDAQWNLQPRVVNQEYFIDRDPDCFSVLLNLLRTGELHIPPNIPEKLLYKEALFYGLMDSVRTAKWGRFDGNQLNVTSSVMGRAPHGWTAIRASPDGGCAVSHGSMVHVYNWMLEDHAPLNLDYRRVNDIAWIDSENIVVSASRRLGEGDGGIGLFSSLTGDLMHRYQVKNQTAGSLCLNSDSKIFGSCTDGIGVWDQVTGEQIDFFNAPSGGLLGYANKIQWLNGSNCLLASSIRSNNYNQPGVCLLDFRDKSMVWSWFNRVHRLYDATVIEESNSVCVAGDSDDLGFIDMRSTTSSIRWNAKIRENRKLDCHCFPKLTLHGGKVFYSYNDSISVFSGPEYAILTSSLVRSGDCSIRDSSGGGASIRDFSIGGDRLFVLHSEENVFDVCESPSPPII